MKYNEDTLVQETTANYLRDQLGWESVYAYNEEKFGPEGTLGRKDDTEVVLTRYLGEALIKLNPGLPQEAYQAAIREITQPTISQSLLHANREKYNLLRDGVLVSYRDEKGALKKARLRVFDFQNPEANHFLCVRELWIKGDLYRRRADIVGFVNGLPLLFMELKNIHRDLRRAYEENLSDYKDTIPHLFEHNAVIVLGNGTTAKIGSLSSRYKHFREWKRLAEEEPGSVDMETLLKGVCSKANFIDLFENFILFDESKETLVKIVAQNQQFLGVNLAVDAVQKSREPRREARRLLAHARSGEVLLDRVFCTESASAHRRQLHLPRVSPTAKTSTGRSTVPSRAAASSTTTKTRAGPGAAQS